MSKFPFGASCEICGVPATVVTNDLKEIPSDDGWAHWEKVKETHWRCDYHPRLPRTIYLNGYEEVGIRLGAS